MISDYSILSSNPNIGYLLPASFPVSANVAEVALTLGINRVGAVKNAAIGVEPFGYISNCWLSLINIWLKPDAAKAIPSAPPTKMKKFSLFLGKLS